MKTKANEHFEMLKTAKATTRAGLKGEGDEAVEMFDTYLMQMLCMVRRAIEEMEKVEARGAERDLGWRYDWNHLTALAAAEAKITFWFEVMAHSSPSKEEPLLTAAGLKKAVQLRFQALMQGHYANNSTNAMSNALDAFKAEVSRQMVRDFGKDLDVGSVTW